MTWTLFRSGELRSANIGSPLFLVEPIIPAGGIVMLHGPKTAGKTQLALTLGCAVATGGTFLGEYSCLPGHVIFIEVDMPLPLLQNRIQIAPETDPIWFLHSEPFDVVRLAAGQPKPDAIAAAQSFSPALVIVDSLRKTHALDENDSSTPSRVYAAWQSLFPHACLAFMHHDRKKPTDPSAWLHPEEAARGTGAWLDDADTGLHLDKVRGTKGGGHVATLTFSKCRTTEEPPPMLVRMHSDTLLVEPTKPSARQALAGWRLANISSSAEDGRNWLIAQGICGRTQAYKHAAEEWAR